MPDPLTIMALGSLIGSGGRALAGLGGGGSDMTGFGHKGDLSSSPWGGGLDYDAAKVDPRFFLSQASQGMGRLGTMLSRRADQPFDLGDPVQQPFAMAGGPFMRGMPIGVRATDPAHWDPNTKLRSPGMNTGDPFYHYSKDLIGGQKDASGNKIPEGFAAPGPEDPLPSEQRASHPDLHQMDAALNLLGVKRDETGRYTYEDPFGSQGMFMGMQGGQHQIPGSEQNPFGGPGATRTGSEGTGDPTPTGPDVRRRRSEWQSA